MITFARNSCLVAIAVCAAANFAPAQTGAPTNAPTAPSVNAAPPQTPAPVLTNRPPRPAPRLLTKRSAGKIASLDAVAKSFVLDPSKEEVQITSRTRITKDRMPATFEDLAVGMQVSVTKRQDASSNWVTMMVVVGVPRQMTNAPVAKP